MKHTCEFCNAVTYATDTLNTFRFRYMNQDHAQSFFVNTLDTPRMRWAWYDKNAKTNSRRTQTHTAAKQNYNVNTLAQTSAVYFYKTLSFLFSAVFFDNVGIAF